MNVVWAPTTMKHFGKVVADALGWPFLLDAPIPDCETVYIIGLYDPPFYGKSLSDTKRAEKRIIHWCGTDSQRIVEPELLPEAQHTAENDFYRDFVRDAGFECETLRMPTKHHPKVTPLPETPTITAYFGCSAEYYGAEYVRLLADVFPDALLQTYGAGEYNEREMEGIIEATTVQVQLGNHGGGHSLREAMEAGRYAITTLPLPHAITTNQDDLPRVIRDVGRALRMTEPDEVAAAYWREHNTEEAFVRGFHELTGI